MELLEKKGAEMACGYLNFAGEAALWPQYQNYLQTTLLTPVTTSIPKPSDTSLSFFLVFSPAYPSAPITVSLTLLITIHSLGSNIDVTSSRGVFASTPLTQHPLVFL